MQRWRQLVGPAWLAGLLAGQNVCAAPPGKWRLLEIANDGLRLFRMGHIPGAGYIDTGELERGPTWRKVADDELLAVLLRNGVRHDTTVILYGRNNLAAARAAHLMLYAGVQDVRLLDGGFDAWTAAGGVLECGPPHAGVPAADFGHSFPANPHYLVDTQGVLDLLRQGEDAVIASIRTWSEYTGQGSGYPYIAAKGEIPGARWGAQAGMAT